MRTFFLFLSFLLILISNTYSQFTFVRTSPAIVYGNPNDPQVQSNATVTNTTSGTIPITIDLSNIVVRQGWDTIAFCTWQNCYPPGLIHKVENCGTGEHPFDVYISPYNMQGIASCRVTMSYQSLSIYQDFTMSTFPVGIKQISQTAAEFNLMQNYPNPFNPSTKIKFSIPKDGFTDLRVYDVLGREVAVLYTGFNKAGEYETEFNSFGIASGVYFYKLTTPDNVSVKKMIVSR